MNTTAYWIAFNKAPGIGPTRLAALLEICGTIDAAWEASIEQLKQAGLDRRALEKILTLRRELDPAAELAKVEKAGFQITCWDDPNYPVNLQLMDNPPPLLYVRGELTEQDAWAVAIVGTRRASAYGREVAHRLATELAQHGITVVSGLALGIDAVAHQAALDAGGRTIAVLGSGVDQLYPAQNRNLAMKIVGQGAVVSEYALGTRPEASNFPPRNRVISGLSRGIIVVEASERSGALITTQYAADQGRDVFAVPGSILHPGSIGCNRLIQDGATPLLSIEDVLEQLNLMRMSEHQAARKTVPLDPLESDLLGHLSAEPCYIDDIVRRAKMSSEQVSSLLTIMELKGVVRQVSAMNYVRSL